MNKLDTNLFAFILWVKNGSKAYASSPETKGVLTINDGYEWYNCMWDIWLKTTEEGITMCNGDTTMNNNPDTTNNTVRTGQNNTGTYPEPGQIWQHYKGGRYEIIAMCNHTDTNEVLVIYRSLSFGGFHARPYSEWHDEMKDGEFWLGKRFKLIN
jgi:hypothetical protein